MTNSRSPRSRPGTALAPEKLERLRSLLEHGDSGKRIASSMGIGEATVRKYREMWLKDGSLVLPERAIANLERGRAIATGGGRPAPLGEAATAAPGEVGRDAEEGAQQAEPARTAIVREPGDIGADEPRVDPRYGRPLDLPTEEDMYALTLNEQGELVFNVRLQIPFSHATMKEMMEKAGLLEPGMNLNTWYVACVDDYLATTCGISLALVRPLASQEEPQREAAFA